MRDTKLGRWFLRVSRVVAVGLMGMAGPLAESVAADDTQVWMESGVRFKTSKKVRVDVAQHLRLDQNVSRVQGVLTDVSLSWRPEKWLRLGGGYRLQFDANKSGQLIPGHRFHLQGGLRTDVQRLTLATRLRFQETFEHKDGGLENKHSIRHRVGFSVDTDSVATPSLSSELFVRIAGKAPIYVSKMRFTLGVDIKPSKRHVVGTYYRLHVPIFDKGDNREHIVGLNYQYRPKRIKRKK